jgi:hypothetical protein
LVGGLIRRFAGENLTINGRDLPSSHWQEVSTLRIYFPLPGAKKPASVRWPAIGWTIRIPAEWKSEIRDRLAQSGVTRDHMYPDFDGCRRLGIHVARNAIAY